MNSDKMQRKNVWTLLLLVMAGLAEVALIILFLKSGGMIRVLSIVGALLLGYLSYETIKGMRKNA